MKNWSKFTLAIAFLATYAMSAPSIWNGTADVSWYESSAQAYNLTTAEQLAGLAQLVNDGTSDFSGKTITIGADIFLNDTTGASDGSWSKKSHRMWTPIGTQSNPFKGEFDGLAGKKNRKIYGLFINDSTKNYVGLFGYTNGVKISNLDLQIGSVCGRNNVGALVGFAVGGSIDGIHSELNVVGSDSVGGLVGTGSKITESSVVADIKGAYYVGGLSGIDSIITESSCIGNVAGISYVGGLVGYGTKIHNSFVEGSVFGSQNYIGGLVGYVGFIESSYMKGTVCGHEFVGGLVGFIWNSVKQSYHENGYVKGFNYVGGAIGKTIGSTEDTYSKADVEGVSFVGGLIGQSYLEAKDYNTYLVTTMVNLQSVGNVVGSLYVGGVIGQDYVYHTRLLSGDASATITRTVANIFSKGDVLGDNFVGGVIGASQRNTPPYDYRELPYSVVSVIDSSYHTDGNIIGKGNYVGGLVGFDSLNTVKNSFKKNGSIYGKDFVGGLIGYAVGLIDSSSFKGNVSGDNYVGGVVGKMKNIRDEKTNSGSKNDYGENGVRHTYARGLIKGSGDYVGGVAGCAVFAHYAQITHELFVNAFFEGNVKGRNFVGGIVGVDSVYKNTSPYTTNRERNEVPLVVVIKGGISKGYISGEKYIGGIIGSSVRGGTKYLDYIKFKMLMSEHSDGDVKGDSSSVGGVAGAFDGAIYNSSHSNGHVEGYGEVGGIAGYADSVIGSFVNGSVTAMESVVGGLVGRTSVIKNSYIIASDVKGINSVGGLAGLASTNVKNSYFIGDSVVGIYQVGGLVGVANGLIDSSYSTANVKGDDNVGGLIGSSHGNISNSFALGNVIGDVDHSSAGNDNLGGLVGYAYKGSISKSLAKGNVSGTTKLGGLVGRFDGSSISQSYANGNVTGGYYGDPADEVGNFYIGGLVGYAKGAVSESYASGIIKGMDEDPVYTGCLIGYVDGALTIDDSYFDNDKCSLSIEGKKGSKTAGAAITNSSGKTTTEMQDEMTFANWDFANTWNILDDSYPFLLFFANSFVNADVTTESLKNMVYDGEAKTPTVSKVELGGVALTENTDYRVDYQNNIDAGTASIKVCGLGVYSGCKIIPFSIAPISLKITLGKIENEIYDSFEKTPAISIYEGENLLEDVGYSAIFANNVNAGTATVEVSLTGNYSGSASATFTIEKAKSVIEELPTAGEIFYGQTLEKSNLEGGSANIEGTFVWSKTDVVPNPVNDCYEVTFIPNDAANYLGAKGMVALVVNKCIVSFMYEGSVLQLDSLMYGDVPQFDGDLPKKNSAQYEYAFKTWSPKISAAAGNQTYIAVFDSTLRKYTVSFYSGDSLLQSSEVEYGSTPTLKGSNPKKVMSEGFSYTFKGWSPKIVSVTDNADYFAVYDSTVRTYTVSFMNGSTTLKTMTLEYGSIPNYTGKPSKASSEKYKYTFAGWSPKVDTVRGDVKYQAVYDSVTRYYIVRFVNGTDVLQKDSVAYGDSAKYRGKTPEKTASKMYEYKFIGWSPKLGAVTKQTDYVAVFDSTKLTGILASCQVNSDLLINVNSRNIQITAAPVGKIYALFDMQGRVLQKGRVESVNYNIVAPCAGSYFIRIGSQTRAVEVK